MNRTPDLPGAAVLQRLEVPIAAELPQQNSGHQVCGNGFAASGAVAGTARDPPPTSQPAETQKPRTGSTSAKWMFDEERFFFEYLRVAKGREKPDEIARSVAKVLKTKDVAQVGAYYESILSTIRRLETFEKHKHSLDRVHYTMLVYWEMYLRPNWEKKQQKAKDKKSKRDTENGTEKDTKQPASETAAGEASGRKSNRSKKDKKRKTDPTTQAPTATPNQSICLEAQGTEPKAMTGNNNLAGTSKQLEAAAVASCGPLPPKEQLIKLRFFPAIEAHAAFLRNSDRKNWGVPTMVVSPSHDLLTILRSIAKGMPGAEFSGGDGSNLYLQAPPDANRALRGVKWGGPVCTAGSLTIGEIVALLPSRGADDPFTLLYSWDLAGQQTQMPQPLVSPPNNMAIPGQTPAQGPGEGRKSVPAAVPAARPEESGPDAMKRAIMAAAAKATSEKPQMFANPASMAAAMNGMAAQMAAPLQTPVGVPPAMSGQGNTPVAPGLERFAPVLFSLPALGPTPAAAVAVPGDAPGMAPAHSPLVHNVLGNSLDAVDAAMAPAMVAGQKRTWAEMQPIDTAMAAAAGAAMVPNNGMEAGADGFEKPAQRPRIPVGLSNLIKTVPPRAAGQNTRKKAAPKPKPKPKPRQPAKGKASAATNSTGPTAQQPTGLPLPVNMSMPYNIAPSNLVHQGPQVLQPQQPLPGQVSNLQMLQALQYQQMYNQMLQMQNLAAQTAGTSPILGAAAPGPVGVTPAPAPAPAAVNPEGNLDSLFAFNITNMGDSLFGTLFENHKTAQQQQQQAAPQVQSQQPVHVQTAPQQPPATVKPAAAAVVEERQFCTPAKGTRPTSANVNVTPTGGDSILRMPMERWAGLSPPPNFKLPSEFGANSPGGVDFAGINSLLLPNSLLGFPEMNRQGDAATAMQKGVEALFQQLTGTPGAVAALDDSLAAVAVAVPPPRGDASLHSLTSLLEKSNSNWMAQFEAAQAANNEKKPSEQPQSAATAAGSGDSGARHFAELFG